MCKIYAEKLNRSKRICVAVHIVYISPYRLYWRRDELHILWILQSVYVHRRFHEFNTIPDDELGKSTLSILYFRQWKQPGGRTWRNWSN